MPDDKTNQELKILVLDDGAAEHQPAVDKLIEELEASTIKRHTVRAERAATFFSECKFPLFAERMKKACNDYDIAIVLLFDDDRTVGSASYDVRLWLQYGYWLQRRRLVNLIDRGTPSGPEELLVFRSAGASIPSNLKGVKTKSIDFKSDGAGGKIVKALSKMVDNWEVRPSRLAWKTIDFITEWLPETKKWEAKGFMESGYSTSRRPCDLTLKLYRILAQEKQRESFLHAQDQLEQQVSLVAERVSDLQKMYSDITQGNNNQGSNLTEGLNAALEASILALREQVAQLVDKPADRVELHALLSQFESSFRLKMRAPETSVEQQIEPPPPQLRVFASRLVVGLSGLPNAINSIAKLFPKEDQDPFVFLGSYLSKGSGTSDQVAIRGYVGQLHRLWDIRDMIAANAAPSGSDEFEIVCNHILDSRQSLDMIHLTLSKRKQLTNSWADEIGKAFSAIASSPRPCDTLRLLLKFQLPLEQTN